MKEEHRSLTMLGKIEEQRFKQNEQDVALLKERVEVLQAEHQEVVQTGDQYYQEYIDNINNQVKEEQQLSEDINAVANRSNTVLHAKLNANKSDFERLRHLGQSVGAKLESKIAAADKELLEVAQIKISAHEGFAKIREHMHTDIGNDQKPLDADMTQVDHTCKLLDEKDEEMYKRLMPKVDLSVKQYLANQISNGLHWIMYSDKVDIEQHIEFNRSGIEKL